MTRMNERRWRKLLQWHPGYWWVYFYYKLATDRQYQGYALIAIGTILAPYGGFILQAAGYWVLSTIKPEGAGGFRSSVTYGYPVVNNSCYEGAPRVKVYGKHTVFPKYVNAYTEQNGDKQTLKAVLYVCEGGSNGIESISDIRLNGQPLDHFTSATVTKRYGTQTQEAPKGFDKVAQHYGVGAEMNKGEVVSYTTHTEVDEIAFLFAWPAGIYHIKQSGSSAGSLEKATWQVAIEMREWNPDTGAWTTWTKVSPTNLTPYQQNWTKHSGNWACKHKTRGVWRNLLRVSFSTQRKREFRLKGLKSNDDATVRKPTLERIEEIVEEAVDYAGVACLFLEATIDGMLADGLPTVSCLVEGEKITLMDGTTAFTRNPAEIIRSYLTDSTDGCGTWISTSDIAGSSGETFRDARDHFAENAASSGDHAEPRIYLDLVMDVQQPAMDWLNHMLTVCRGMLVEWDGKLQLLVDKTASADRTFDGRTQDSLPAANRPMLELSDGRPDINEQQIPNDQRLTHLRIGYYDETDFHKPAWTKELVNPDWTAGDPVVREEISIPGITRQTQALRHGRFVLNGSRLRDRIFDWGIGPGDLDLVPMDVVTLKTTNPELTARNVQVLSVQADRFGFGRAAGVIYDANVYTDTTDLKTTKKKVTRQLAEKYRVNPIETRPRKGASNVRVKVRSA